MEMGAFTGALVALLAKDMASAIASEMGKDVSGAAKQALRRLGQRLRREPATRAAMEQLETNPTQAARRDVPTASSPTTSMPPRSQVRRWCEKSLGSPTVRTIRSQVASNA